MKVLDDDWIVWIVESLVYDEVILQEWMVICCCWHVRKVPRHCSRCYGCCHCLCSLLVMHATIHIDLRWSRFQMSYAEWDPKQVVWQIETQVMCDGLILQCCLFVYIRCDPTSSQKVYHRHRRISVQAESGQVV